MDPLFKELHVSLTNGAGPNSSQITLDYQIRNIPAAQIWARCIQEANQKGGLRERDRFDNFPDHPRSRLENLLKLMEDTVAKLKPLHPELDFPSVDTSRLQESINHLHFHFAHGHHVTEAIQASNGELWSLFNVVLHAIEHRLREVDDGMPNAFIIATWHQPMATPLPKDELSRFCVNMEAGAAYIQYSQIGRHFVEMFYAGDDALDDEHIRPCNTISADTLLWFGPSRDQYWARDLNQQVETWFMTRRERFEKLGYCWGDPKLALGQIPVAKLKESLHTEREIVEFAKYLSRFRQVSEIWVS